MVGFLHPADGVNDKHRQIGLCKCLPGALYAQLAQRAFIVNAGRIDDYNRSNRQKLHRFLHGVSRCPLDVGNEGHLLSGHGVNDA